MRPLRVLLAGVAALTLLTACASGTEPATQASAPPLGGTSWILDDVMVDGEATAAVDANASLNFAADGSLNGSTGCNRFMGTWTADGDSLTLQTGGMTLMACTGPLESQEKAVLDALAATRSYTVSDDVLTLTGDDGTELARYAAATTDLAGTSWTANGVNNGNGGVETTALTSQLTIEFGAQGEVGGFGGCTDFSGTYATDGPAISITELAAGDCSDTSLAPQQEQYLNALAAATNFSIDGNRLDLRDEAGALQAGFTAQ